LGVNIAHLEYKNDLGIPSHLRKDFYAISGLLYVVDTHFEIFYKEKIKSGNYTDSNKKLAVEINLDTFKAFLESKFEDREVCHASLISKLLAEIQAVGYKNISELNQVVDKGMKKFLAYEKDYPPSGDGKFANVGAMRVLLELNDERYLRYRKKQDPKYAEHYDDLRKYKPK
jgi:putative GTP pyrophosphokinase